MHRRDMGNPHTILRTTSPMRHRLFRQQIVHGLQRRFASCHASSPLEKSDRSFIATPTETSTVIRHPIVVAHIPRIVEMQTGSWMARFLPGPQNVNGNFGQGSYPNGTDGMSFCSVAPVAIIDMAMPLRGGIHDAERLSDLLINKRDGRC